MVGVLYGNCQLKRVLLVHRLSITATGPAVNWPHDRLEEMTKEGTLVQDTPARNCFLDSFASEPKNDERPAEAHRPYPLRVDLIGAGRLRQKRTAGPGPARCHRRQSHQQAHPGLGRV